MEGLLFTGAARRVRAAPWWHGMAGQAGNESKAVTQRHRPRLPLSRTLDAADSRPGTVIIALLAAHNGRRGTCEPLDDN
ncbi:hypothetical protein E2C01_078893 [Portunus trituberculatus]|uniref:Uncharacterized protein n=1 Tax=Portunus trituberculatus TaxID=210409 RepID=A0A5B7INW9_PORTR|nr:hypothetical protein [Portunus trituberculatus]